MAEGSKDYSRARDLSGALPGASETPEKDLPKPDALGRLGSGKSDAPAPGPKKSYSTTPNDKRKIFKGDDPSGGPSARVEPGQPSAEPRTTDSPGTSASTKKSEQSPQASQQSDGVSSAPLPDLDDSGWGTASPPGGDSPQMIASDTPTENRRKRYSPKPGGKGSSGTSQPNSKGQIVNTGVQALGGAAGNVAGGAAAGAAGAGGSAASSAAKGAAGSGSKSAQDLGRDMAKKSLKDGANDVKKQALDQAKAGGARPESQDESQEGGEHGDNTWGGLAKDVGGSLKDAARSRSSVNPLDDDDRTRGTRARDNLKQRTGIDADKAVGAAAGGAAATATAATGVGVAAAGAVGAAAGAVGEQASKMTQNVKTKFVGLRKSATIVVGGLAALFLSSMLALLGGAAATQQQQNQSQATDVYTIATTQERQIDTAAEACAVEQEAFPPIALSGRAGQVVEPILIAAEEAGIAKYGVVIAVAAGLGESGLDPQATKDGTFGIFGFPAGDNTGTEEELLDPSFSASLFFARLQEVEGWAALPLDQVATTVLESAFPGTYGPFESAARAVLRQSGDDSFGAGCEPLGTPVSCAPNEVFEAEFPVLTPDARSLARCLFERQKVSVIEADAEGRTLAVTVPGNADFAASLASPTASTSEVETGSAADTLSWLSGSNQTFGIDSITYLGQTAEFRPLAEVAADREAGVKDVERFTITGTANEVEDSSTIFIEVYGTAGTGVLSGASGTWMMPVTPPCVSSEFGMRVNPVTKVYKLHAGIDFPVPTGTTVFAASSGTVLRTFYSPGGGNMVVIDNGGGITTEYLHNISFIAEAGDVVDAGTPIARAGSTGNSSGPHVHFNVKRHGAPEDPRPFLEGVGVTVPASCS